MSSSLSLGRYEIEKLISDIRSSGIQEVPVKSQYELLRVKDDKTSIIIYSSGKVVHNNTSQARSLIDGVVVDDSSYDLYLGSDETGKGEWYGPLVVVCCALGPEHISFVRRLGVRDSKSIASSSIRKMAYDLKSLGARYKSVVLMPEEYNKAYDRFQNLNELLAWAHEKAIKDLLSKAEFENAFLVVDRFDEKKTARRLSDLPGNVKVLQKTRGESEPAVAAASILAKDLFERRLSLLNERFGLDLKNTKPGKIPSEVLPKVAKLHFKNVS